ncbi:ATP-binding cassette subfamily C member 4-like [Pocillopora verrucosa]|uniref:ATP-binding cassette subfamily C member 4-like n=1 Tax=Pocillopora verrucosa TaxID=203993 RepID=UPI0033427CF7
MYVTRRKAGWRKIVEIPFGMKDENSGRFVTDQLRKSWESEKHHCKVNGKRPKLWKSVFDTPSAKDVIIILKGNILSATSVLLFPLFLGYLLSKLMSTEAENTYQLYACALAMCLNGLIGGLGMHQRSYRCEILGIKIGSALRGLVYHKTLLLSKQTLLRFTAGRLFDLISNDVKRMEEDTVKFIVLAVFAVPAYAGAIFLIYYFIGWQAVTGVFLLCILMPYAAVLSYANGKLRLRTATVSDQRISPMNQVVSGIRAVKMHAWEDEYGREIKRVRRYQDVHNQAYIMVMASGRWLGTRLDCLASLLVGAVALAAILVSQDAAYASLALVYVIQTLAMTQYAVRKTSEVENYMTSV